MSPKRAVLPGKDLLFNQRAAGPGGTALSTGAAPVLSPVQPEPEEAWPGPGGTGVSPVLAPAPEPAVAPEPSVDLSRHVQLCVWVDPAVAHEVDRARARLLMEEGLKVTKSQIVEALLRPGLADLDALVRLLNQ